MSDSGRRWTDSRPSLRQRVLDTFREYGGWWILEGMAGWLSVSPQALRKVWDELEAEGLLERKPGRMGSVKAERSQ